MQKHTTVHHLGREPGCVVFDHLDEVSSAADRFFACRSASCLYFSSQVLLLCSNNLNFSPTLRTSSPPPFLLLLSHPSPSASPPFLPLWFYRVLFGVLLSALLVHHILIPFAHCLLSFRPMTLSLCPFTACVFMITLWIDCLYCLWKWPVAPTF